MFRYSTDELIADGQQKETDEIFLMLAKHANPYYSEKIDRVFSSSKMTFEYLVDFAKLLEKNKQKVTLIVTPRCKEYIKYGNPRGDVDQGFAAQNKSRDDLVPYIEYSFHEGYENPHGAHYNHCFFLFFTAHSSFEESEEYTRYWLKKITTLKAFL